jgi:hypothetical protein
MQSAIEERFRDAYENQIKYLQQTAQEEMATVETDIGRLRRIAWSAQASAAEHARQADVSRVALRARETDTRTIQQALYQARRALQSEMAALHGTKASLHRTEWEHAEVRAWANKEVAEMRACYEEVARKHQSEKKSLVNLEREFTTVRAEIQAEQEAAREQAKRAEAASAATAAAKASLAWRDSIAEQTLREAVQRLEADFARERADFLEQDRRSQARAQAIEREAQKEAWGMVGRAITRPQAASTHGVAAPAAASVRQSGR